jgi:hypothetical protein
MSLLAWLDWSYGRSCLQWTGKDRLEKMLRHYRRASNSSPISPLTGANPHLR